MSETALRLLMPLPLPDAGGRWGDVAADFQLADAEAVLAPGSGPRRNFLCRPRGASKTTDAAAYALALLPTAPGRSRSYLYAADRDQAAEILDALATMIEAAPGLKDSLRVSANQVEVKSTGATLAVESSDAASAWSKRPWLVVIDELSSWPDTQNHRRLWAAITSALPKRRDSRLVVLSMAGSPSHFSHKVFKNAGTDPGWRLSHVPGPCPWWTPEDVEQARRDLEIVTEGEFRRVILCEWVEVEEEILARPEDVAAITRDTGTLEPVKGTDYVAALDIGTRRDYTAFSVGHAESRAGVRIAVVDYVRHWRPTKTRRVDIETDVQPVVEQVCQRYGARLRWDRSQAEDLDQRLRRAGVSTKEYVFSTAGANRVAKSLATAVRDRRLDIPDDGELADELVTTKLVETGPGTVKLVNPAGKHDDVAVTVGMITADLMSRGEYGPVNTNAVATFANSDLHRPSPSNFSPFSSTVPGRSESLHGDAIQRRTVRRARMRINGRDVVVPWR